MHVRNSEPASKIAQCGRIKSHQSHQTGSVAVRTGLKVHPIPAVGQIIFLPNNACPQRVRSIIAHAHERVKRSTTHTMRRSHCAIFLSMLCYAPHHTTHTHTHTHTHACTHTRTHTHTVISHLRNGDLWENSVFRKSGCAHKVEEFHSF